MAVDDNYSAVTLLLHGNGLNGTTVFTDNAVVPSTITPVGNTQISTAQSVFGSSSMLFDGAGDTLSVPYNTKFDVGTNLTIEAWVWKPATTALCVVSSRNVGNINYHLFVGTTLALDTGPSGGLLSLVGATTVTSNTWHHVAAVKSGTTWKLFLDGVLDATGTATGTYTATGQPLIIGASSNNYYFNGYIDDLRISNVARYSATFTAPIAEFGDSGISVSAMLPPLSVAAIGGGNAVAQLPKFSMYAGLIGSVTSSVTLPQLSTQSHGGSDAAILLPGLTAYIVGHDSTGDRAADITLPSLTVAIRTGAKSAVSLPKLSSAATGTVTNLADADLSLPSLTTAASVTVAGMANAAISLPSMSGSSYAGALCSVTLGGITTKATVTAGGVGGAQVTLPLFQATAIATTQNRGSAAIVLPSMQMGATVRAALILPSLQLTVIGTAVVTATYEAYAVNLSHTPRGNEQPNDEATHYTNFPFTHVVRYKNSYYGANSTGLYLLEGTTDAGTQIPWEVKTAITDFKSPMKKVPESVYFSGRFGPNSTIRLHVGEKTPITYAFSTPRGQLAQGHRQKFGKGKECQSRYYALSASGTGEADIDGIEPVFHNTTRRI